MTQQPHPSAIVSTEDIEGTAVYDAAGKKMGRVDHLMIDKASGSVTAAVINVAGFFGIGHSHREVPWKALSYSAKLHGYQLSNEYSHE